MTTRPLATKPEEFAATFAATFNRGSLDEVVAGYAEDAVLNLGGGNVQCGHSEIRAALAISRSAPADAGHAAYALCLG